MNETALVTGGAGFIGSHIVEELVNQRYNVKVFDSLVKGKKSSIQKLIDQGKVEFIEGDLRDRDSVDKAMKNVNYIFHTAGIHIIRSMESPDECIEVNIRGSYNIFKSACDHNVKRIIFSSSSSVYGDPDRLPMSEDSEIKPTEPYGASKWMCEKLLEFLAKKNGIEYNILRYFNVYGKRQDPAGEYACLIPRFIKMIHEGKQPTIFGDGLQSRDFTHVSDVARANIAAATASRKECFGQAFNIGAGNNVSVNEVTKDIQKILEKKIEPIHAPPVIEPKHTRASIKKSKELLGWEPKIVFEEGLRQTVEYILSL